MEGGTRGSRDRQWRSARAKSWSRRHRSLVRNARFAWTSTQAVIILRVSNVACSLPVPGVCACCIRLPLMRLRLQASVATMSSAGSASPRTKARAAFTQQATRHTNQHVPITRGDFPVSRIPTHMTRTPTTARTRTRTTMKTETTIELARLYELGSASDKFAEWSIVDPRGVRLPGASPRSGRSRGEGRQVFFRAGKKIEQSGTR